jgi:hypothetical protein
VGLDVAVADEPIAVRSIQTIVGYGPTQVFESRPNFHVIALLFGLYVHPVPLSWVDLYVGPVVGPIYYRYGSSFFAVNDETSTAFGGALGFDVPFHARGWAAGANARLLRAQFPFIEGGSLTQTFVLVSAGISYRW